MIVSLVLTMSWRGVAKQREFKIYMAPEHVFATYEEVFKEFEKTYGYKVRVEKAAWSEMRPKILADFVAGTPPDLLESRPGWTIEFGLLGFLTDLTERISQWPDSQDWFESALKEPSYKGRFYGVKIHATCTALFYNRSLFRKAGLDVDNPPKTWKEMLEVAKTLTQDLDGDGSPDQYGYGMDPILGAPAGVFVGWLGASGTSYFNESGTLVNLDTPEAIELGRFLQRLKKWSYVAEPAGPVTAVRRLFASKRNIGMIITGPWDISNFLEIAPDLDYSVDHIPVPEGNPWGSSGHGTHITIPKGTKTADDAWELVKMLTATEVEVETTKQFGMTFPRNSWAEDPAIQKMPLIGKFGSLIGYATPYFGLQVSKLGVPKAAGKIGRTLLMELYERIVYLEEDPAVAFKDFTQKANRLIEEERGL